MKIDRNSTLNNISTDFELPPSKKHKLAEESDTHKGAAILNKTPFMDLENTSPTANSNSNNTDIKKGRNAPLNNNEVLTPVETAPHVPNYRVDMKLKSPSPTEDDYIKADKVHTHHGRVTHYYRDEAKHEMLLAVKVNG